MIENQAQGVDWVAVAIRFQEEMNKLVHAEGDTRPFGNEFYADALRRAFGYVEPSGRRRFPSLRWGLTTEAERDDLIQAHIVVDRMNRERAERERDEARERERHTLRNAAQMCADHIRARCNERTVPARLRREGALLAADWIDSRVPKDQFGNIAKTEIAE